MASFRKGLGVAAAAVAIAALALTGCSSGGGSGDGSAAPTGAALPDDQQNLTFIPNYAVPSVDVPC